MADVPPNVTPQGPGANAPYAYPTAGNPDTTPAFLAANITPRGPGYNAPYAPPPPDSTAAFRLANITPKSPSG